jgi:hypothetical protein
MQQTAAFILGIFLLLSAGALGFSLSDGLLKYKQMDRIVMVKGLAEQDVMADTVIWPIQYTRAGDDLTLLYDGIARDRKQLLRFLDEKGFIQDEITMNAPLVHDRLSNQYGGNYEGGYRYIINQTISVYTNKVNQAKDAMVAIEALGKEGITFKVDPYENRVEYIYSGLNEIKPQMLKEATLNARAAAQTFADDSQSKLGKIKNATQGQFSIYDRDKNSPHIKKVRVVSTVEYYLND